MRFEKYPQSLNIFVVWLATLLRPGHIAAQGQTATSCKCVSVVNTCRVWGRSGCSTGFASRTSNTNATFADISAVGFQESLLEHASCFVRLWTWMGALTCLNQ